MIRYNRGMFVIKMFYIKVELIYDMILYEVFYLLWVSIFYNNFFIFFLIWIGFFWGVNCLIMLFLWSIKNLVKFYLIFLLKNLCCVVVKYLNKGNWCFFFMFIFWCIGKVIL